MATPAERSALRLRRRNRSGTGNRPNVQLNRDSVSRPNKRKRNKRVRLRGRLAGRPAPWAHPTPPTRMHRQRDRGMRGASWVLGAWSSGAHAMLRWWVAGPRPPGANMASGAHGTAGVEEAAEKRFIELETGQVMLSELFLGPSTPAVPCASRNPPAESAGPRLGAGFPGAARVARGRSSSRQR